jgi:hypothetical protein
MTIDDIKAAKRKLEADLLVMVGARLEEFTKETGMFVKDLHPGFFAYQRLEEGFPRCTLSQMHVEIETGL